MRGNFVDVPTDCPQRDERLGWTGDITAFAPTSTFLYDCAGFLTSWLADLSLDQKANGAVPYVIPDVLSQEDPTAAAWGDAAVIVPWVLFKRFGDADILRRQLPSMMKWVDREARLAGDDLLWTGSFQFGDWLDPTAPPEDAAKTKVDPDLVATAWFARSAQVVADAAFVLGEDKFVVKYGRLAESVREAIRCEYVKPDGRVHSDSQTGYTMMIAFDLLENDEQRLLAGERLAGLVREAGYHIATGFVGTPIIMDALCSTGQADTAWQLLLQQGCPSWLYPVTMGATTIWERWDAMLPDGSINPGEMTSFNHYALGAVADWMHRSLAGLAPGGPGYREMVVQPVLSGEVTTATARHLTPYGEAAVTWTRENGTFSLQLDIPVGATAAVTLPGSPEAICVAHGSHAWDVTDPFVPR
jgi:alpha-L-rhamnosidase